MDKLPFDIDLVVERIRQAVQLYPKAALFELAELGFASPFEQLVACIISIRTFDETTLPAALRLFAQARTPAQIAALEGTEIGRLIYPATFHERKGRQIRDLAERVEREFGGILPIEPQTMMTFKGVGMKCANLAAGIAGAAKGLPAAGVSVDIHVHRVTNRWGYITERTPEASSRALEARLPPEYRLEINRLLVPFGKHICTGARPRCPACPVLEMCRQVGVSVPPAALPAKP